MTLPARLPLLLFAAALGAAWWRALPPAPAAFVAPPPPIASALPAEFASAPLPAAAASAHAATLAELPDGRIACAWFAGSREGAADVAIWLALREQGQWSTPRLIVDRQMLANASLSHVRKLGNPVLYAQGDKLHLWVVSAGVGGWAGSAINHLQSTDGGQNWSTPERLQTSPFFNISTLVRSAPAPLADGGLGLPVYHEFLAKHGEWLRLDASGRVLDKARMPQPVAALQPAVAVLDGLRAVALLRDAEPDESKIRVARSDNGGQLWQTAPALPLDNPNSSVALLRLASGRLLLAANPKEGRRVLELWISDDDGQQWRNARTVERADDDRAEFSYPALLQARDGRVHLAYTWQRTTIRHVVFSEAWLLEKAP